MERAPLVTVVGPTASGKSDLALALAAELGGESGNADALQLYRGMDIGTAQPPPGAAAGLAPLVAVVRPAASGTPALALALAAERGGETVNAAALQLYRGMDIGTAKLRPEQREGIAHHQLDVLEVTQEASVSAYQQAARE